MCYATHDYDDYVDETCDWATVNDDSGNCNDNSKMCFGNLFII